MRCDVALDLILETVFVGSFLDYLCRLDGFNERIYTTNYLCPTFASPCSPGVVCKKGRRWSYQLRWFE